MPYVCQIIGYTDDKDFDCGSLWWISQHYNIFLFFLALKHLKIYIVSFFLYHLPMIFFIYSNFSMSTSVHC